MTEDEKDMTQLICSNLICACVGYATSWDECACREGAGNVCRDCGAALCRIDINTGEPVTEAA